MNSFNVNITAWPRCLATLRVKDSSELPAVAILYLLLSQCNGETHNLALRLLENVSESIDI